VVAEEARRGWIASATRETLETAGAAFCSKTVGEARAKRCGAEDGRMVYAGKGDAPLLDVVRAGFLRHVVEPSTYADGASGDEAASTRRTAAYVGRRATACHRVAVYRLDYDPEVMDDTMVIDAVVSQSDVARFLGEHRAELGAALERNLADLGLAPGVDDDEGVRDDAARDDGAGAPYRSLAESVERVSPTTRAIEAFSLMRSRGVSSVAVCAEPRGKLVDVLALSDFRGARAPGDFADLDLSVAEFAAKRRPPGAGARLVTVRPDADLGDVLRLMSDNGVHRVFVTDLEGRPTRCVTPTDVFRLVALPSAHNLGWRFQATDAGRATYAREEPTPLAPREDESPPPARRAFGFAGAFDDET
jgi:CBS domain-containing protein